MDPHDWSSLLGCLGWGWLLAALVMLAAWITQAVRRDATLVDVAWALNLGALAALYAWLSPELPSRRILIATVAGAWALRLAGYLLLHRAIGQGEDGRYRALREAWGSRAQRNFFWFFQAQALLDVILSIPFLLVAWNPARDLHPLELVGAVLWLVAIVGETVADRQLARFKRRADSRGRTCREGLWRTSRHPNYFFEWLHWIAYALIAFMAPHGWIALSAPAIMLFLLWRVTGIPATEAHALKSRGADYADYQRTTSAFVPWFPKRG